MWVKKAEENDMHLVGVNLWRPEMGIICPYILLLTFGLFLCMELSFFGKAGNQ